MTDQIVYSSQASESMTAADLEGILEHSRVANHLNHITGALVYVEGVFLQILEGEKTEVTKLMERIQQDPRHHSVKIFFEAEASDRTFGSWRMAFVDATPEQLATWAGCPETATIEDIVEDIEQNPDRLAQFAGGMLKVLSLSA